MPVLAGDVLQVRVGSSFQDDHLFLNVFYVRVDIVPTGGDDQILTDLWTWISSIYTPIAGLYPVGWDTDEPTVINLTQNEFVGSLNGEVTGSGTGEVLPFQSAALVLGKTATLGHTARKYFGPFTEAAQDGSLWSGAAVTALVNAGIAWDADPVAAVDGTYTSGVYNTRELPAPVFRPIVDSKVIPYVRTQRSRSRGQRF